MGNTFGCPSKFSLSMGEGPHLDFHREIASGSLIGLDEAIQRSGKEIVNVKDGQGRTALHLASSLTFTVAGITNGWERRLKQAGERSLFDVAMALLDHGANAMAMDEHGVTPLHVAAVGHTSWNCELLRALVTHGADAAVTDAYGKLPLHYALAPKKVRRGGRGEEDSELGSLLVMDEEDEDEDNDDDEENGINDMEDEPDEVLLMPSEEIDDEGSSINNVGIDGMPLMKREDPPSTSDEFITTTMPSAARRRRGRRSFGDGEDEMFDLDAADDNNNNDIPSRSRNIPVPSSSTASSSLQQKQPGRRRRRGYDNSSSSSSAGLADDCNTALALLRLGSPFMQSDNSGSQPIFMALESQNFSFFMAAVESNPMVLAAKRSRDGSTPLHLALRVAPAYVCDKVLRFCSNLNEKDKSGQTPLLCLLNPKDFGTKGRAKRVHSFRIANSTGSGSVSGSSSGRDKSPRSDTTSVYLYGGGQAVSGGSGGAAFFDANSLVLSESELVMSGETNLRNAVAGSNMNASSVSSSSSSQGYSSRKINAVAAAAVAAASELQSEQDHPEYEKENLALSLLDAKADPTVKDLMGWTPLHRACALGWVRTVEKICTLTDKNMWLSSCGENAQSPLAIALLNGHNTTAGALLAFLEPLVIKYYERNELVGGDGDGEEDNEDDDVSASSGRMGFTAMKENAAGDFFKLQDEEEEEDSAAPPADNVNVNTVFQQSSRLFAEQSMDNLSYYRGEDTLYPVSVAAPLREDDDEFDLLISPLGTREFLAAAGCPVTSAPLSFLLSWMKQRRLPLPSESSLTDKRGRGPVHVAAMAGLPATLEILVREAGFDPGAEDERGNSPLHLVVCCRTEKISATTKTSSSFGIQQQQFLQPKSGNTNNTGLVGGSKVEVLKKCVEVLIGAGAGVNAANKRGETPLHLAIRASTDCEVVNLLLSFGADPNIRDNQKQSALALLCSLLAHSSLSKRTPPPLSSRAHQLYLLIASGARVDRVVKAIKIALNPPSEDPSIKATRETRSSTSSISSISSATTATSHHQHGHHHHSSSNSSNSSSQSRVIRKKSPAERQVDESLLQMLQETPLMCAVRLGDLDRIREICGNPPLTFTLSPTPSPLRGPSSHPSPLAARLQPGGISSPAGSGHNSPALRSSPPPLLLTTGASSPLPPAAMRTNSSSNENNKTSVNNNKYAGKVDEFLTRTDQFGYSPIHLAARNRHPQILQLLLSAHADPNSLTTSIPTITTNHNNNSHSSSSSSSSSFSPLHLVLKSVENGGGIGMDGEVSVCVELLLKARSNVNMQDDSGNSPLLYATKFLLPLTAEKLIRGGADVSLVNRQGETASRVAMALIQKAPTYAAATRIAELQQLIANSSQMSPPPAIARVQSSGR